jgi:hypothetical protein
MIATITKKMRFNKEMTSLEITSLEEDLPKGRTLARRNRTIALSIGDRIDLYFYARIFQMFVSEAYVRRLLAVEWDSVVCVVFCCEVFNRSSFSFCKCSFVAGSQFPVCLLNRSLYKRVSLTCSACSAFSICNSNVLR